MPQLGTFVEEKSGPRLGQFVEEKTTPKLGQMTEEPHQPRLGQFVDEATGQPVETPAVKAPVSRTGALPQNVLATPTEEEIGWSELLTESPRLGMKHVTHSLSRILYQARSFMGTQLMYGGDLSTLPGINMITRSMNPDLAKQQDAEVTALLEKYDKLETKVLGADREKSLLPSIEGPSDLLSAKRITNIALEQGPLFAAQLGVTLLNPAAGTMLMAGIEGGSAKEEMLQKEAEGGKIDGVTREFVPAVVGAFNGALELVGLEPILKLAKGSSFLKSKLFSVIAGMITEPLTEAAQEFNQDAAGKITEFGGLDGYYEELKANGIGKDTISRVKDAFYSAIVLSGIGGGSVAYARHLAENAHTRSLQDTKNLIEDELAKLKVESRALPTDVADNVKRAVHEEAAELDAAAPPNLDEYVQAAQQGQMPVYIGLPKKLADYAKLTGHQFTDTQSIIDFGWKAINVDPNKLSQELREYVEQDARERLAEGQVLGINLSTANVARKWGGVTKSVLEEMIRRGQVAKQVMGEPEKLAEVDQTIKAQNLGEVTPVSSTMQIDAENANRFATALTDVQRGVNSGTLTPRFAGKLIYSALANLQQGKAVIDEPQTTSESTDILTESQRTTQQTVEDLRNEYFQAIQSGDVGQQQSLDGEIQQLINAMRLEEKARRTPVLPGELYPAEDNDAPQQLLPEQKQRDIAPKGFHKWLGPVFALRNHPAAQAMAQAIVDAGLLVNRLTSNHYSLFDEIIGQIGKGNRAKLRGAMELVYNGEADSIQNEKLRTAAQQMVEWFAQRRDAIKDYKRLMLRLTMSPQEWQAFQDVLTGTRTVSDAAAYYKVDNGGLVEAITDYIAIDKWGIDNYITNAMVGSWKAVTPDGHVVTVAPTKRILTQRVVEYFNAHPEVKELHIDTSGPNIEMGYPMGKRAYFTMVGKIAKALENGTEDISRQVATEAAKQGLRRIVSIKPSKKWSPYLMKRKGTLEGEADLFDVLYSYAHSVEKKMALDPVIYEISKNMDGLPKHVKELLTQQIDDSKGRYYEADQLVDWIAETLQDVNIPFTNATVGDVTHIGTGRPFRASRAQAWLTKGTALAKLGYRVVGMAVNKLGGEHHVWTKVGLNYALRAKKWMNTEEGKAFIKSEEDIGQLGNTFALPSGKQNIPWWHALYLFNKPETGLRRYGLAAGYLVARDMGMNPAHARYYARQLMHQSLFLYNTEALPSVLRGPFGRVAGQFRAYLSQELQFISQLTPRQALRYWTGFLILGGPRAAIQLAKTLPFIGMAIGFDRLDEWINKEWPRFSRGIWGLLGGDATAAAGFQLPTTMEDLAGATIGEFWRLYSKVFVPMISGSAHTFENFKEWSRSVITVQKNFAQAINMVMSHDGWIRDSNGNPAWRPEAWWDLALTMAGVTPLGKSQQDTAERIYLRELQVNRENYEKEMDILTRQFHYGEDLKGVVAKMNKYVHDGGVLPIPLLNALTEYAATTGQITPEKIDRLISFGLTSQQAINLRLKKSYMAPQERRLEEARLLEKLRALGAFDLEYGGRR